MNEKLRHIQEQKQEQKLMQGITQQQLLQLKLIELPITQLLERIDTEMDINPAIEKAENAESPEQDEYTDFLENPEISDDVNDYETQRDLEDRQAAMDDALKLIGGDDGELPIHTPKSNEGTAEFIYGGTISFYDQLKEQMGFVSLTEQERDIMEYLIGSLDDDGLLRKPLGTIAEELAIQYYIDVTEQEIEQVLKELQRFDPAGIGARSLQECLLLQIERRSDSTQKSLMKRVITDYFDAFTKKHWDKIQSALRLSDVQAEKLFSELRRLNPKPGASLGETVGVNIQQITPDFIVETHDDGTITFSLNQDGLPDLQVSQSYTDTINAYQDSKENMSSRMKDQLLTVRKQVASARNFIEAIRVRRHTLTITMRAIIQWQHQFFLEGDEASLHPMKLRDIADKTGLGQSTISRVSNSKYAQTRWGTFPLRYFFSDSYTTEQGEELSTRQIKAALRDIIEAENPDKPLSDEALAAQMATRGYAIARRTVAKYREQMGIPVSRLRIARQRK